MWFFSLFPPPPPISCIRWNTLLNKNLRYFGDALRVFVCLLVLPFPQLVEIPRSETEPAPKQQLELLQWQCQILNLPCHKRTPESSPFFFFLICKVKKKGESYLLYLTSSHRHSCCFSLRKWGSEYTYTLLWNSLNQTEMIILGYGFYTPFKHKTLRFFPHLKQHVEF